MKKQKGKLNFSLPVIAAALLIVAGFLFSGGNTTGKAAAALNSESGAFANPSLSGAVVVITYVAPRTDVACRDETEKGYSYDAGSGSFKQDSYRIVKKCSDGSETVVKDWTPVS